MTLPIGVFDSGVGGLTVVKELKKALPHKPILYFGDTARVPYGTKSRETIIRYSLEIGETLIERGIEGLVIACNTASAYAAEELQKYFSLPIFGVIAPGAKKAVESTNNGRIGVIGTRATISSNAYEVEIKKIDPKIEVFSTPCPLFVPLVEEGLRSKEAEELIAKEYLLPLVEESIDTLLLGCTHYPLLTELIGRVLGPEIKIIDSASAVASEVENHLSPYGRGEDLYLVSDDCERFKRTATRFLESEIEAELFQELGSVRHF